MHHMARHDALTGLPNRQFVRETFDHLMDKYPAAVLSLDLDGFKTVNDAYGHAAGDLLLRRAAERLRQCVEQADIIARLGGVEFVVVRPGMHRSEDLLRLARKIIDSVGGPYNLEGAHADIGVNIGLALAPRDGQSADELIKAAGLALYRAKTSAAGATWNMSREWTLASRQGRR